MWRVVVHTNVESVYSYNHSLYQSDRSSHGGIFEVVRDWFAGVVQNFGISKCISNEDVAVFYLVIDIM